MYPKHTSYSRESATLSIIKTRPNHRSFISIILFLFCWSYLIFLQLTSCAWNPKRLEVYTAGLDGNLYTWPLLRKTPTDWSSVVKARLSGNPVDPLNVIRIRQYFVSDLTLKARWHAKLCTKYFNDWCIQWNFPYGILLFIWKTGTAFLITFCKCAVCLGRLNIFKRWITLMIIEFNQFFNLGIRFGWMLNVYDQKFRW